MSQHLLCPKCGIPVETYRNPAPTVDVVIHVPGRGVVLVERGREPFGQALPGGFVEVGETVEQAAVREALEETGLRVHLTGLLGVYSDPARDPRRHTLSTVFLARTDEPEQLKAGDDAAAAAFFPLAMLPGYAGAGSVTEREIGTGGKAEIPVLAFDHARILGHFQAVLRGERTAATVDSDNWSGTQ